MSAKVDRPLLITSTLVHAPTSLLNAGVAQYLAVTKKLVTANYAQVLIDAMKQAAPDSVRSVSYYGEFVLVLARKPGSPCHLKRWYVEEGAAEVRFLSAYPSGEYECIRLFTQCKHTCLLKRWYVEEGAFEVSFLAEYGSGECECIRLFTKCMLLRRVRLSM